MLNAAGPEPEIANSFPEENLARWWSEFTAAALNRLAPARKSNWNRVGAFAGAAFKLLPNGERSCLQKFCEWTRMNRSSIGSNTLCHASGAVRWSEFRPTPSTA